jgi:4'-phosphopantetheinyl transferase
MHYRDQTMTPTHVSWRLAPQKLEIETNDIHVWRADLKINNHRLHDHYQILSVEEKDRSARFKFQKDRDHFIAAHGILRVILSRYLHIDPDQLRFYTNDFGKPFLNQPTEPETLRFNMSHSNGLALYAVSHDREIGIDLEYLRPIDNAEQIAERFFSPREIEQWRTLPGHRQNEGFFHCWVRKEAYIKAIGKGLFQPLDQFDTSLSPDGPSTPLHSSKDPRKKIPWSLMDIHAHPDFAAALSVEGHDYQLKCWQWSE